MVACGCDGQDFSSRATKRIVIQSPGDVPDDSGGRVVTWSDTYTLWAIMEPKGGKEMFLSAQLQSRVDAVITIRYQAGLADTTTAAKCRVKFGSRYLNIKFSKNLHDDMKTEGTAYQQLFCTEGEQS